MKLGDNSTSQTIEPEKNNWNSKYHYCWRIGPKEMKLLNSHLEIFNI